MSIVYVFTGSFLLATLGVVSVFFGICALASSDAETPCALPQAEESRSRCA